MYRVKGKFDYNRQNRWRCLHAFRSCLDLHIPLLLAGDTTTSTDVCRHNGKFLKCDSNSVLKIRNVICMPNNYTCPEKNRIVSICEGQRSCENFGIRQQLWTYCQDHPSRTVLVDFKCEPGIILIVLFQILHKAVIILDLLLLDLNVEKFTKYFFCVRNFIYSQSLNNMYKF